MSRSFYFKNIKTRNIPRYMFLSAVSGILSIWLSFYLLKDCTGKEWYMWPAVLSEIFYLLFVGIFNINISIELEFERNRETPEERNRYEK